MEDSITTTRDRIAQGFLTFALLLYLNTAGAASSVTGTWEYHGQAGAGLWLKTEQTGNIIRFQLEISRGAPSYNSGWIEGEVEIHKNIGRFQKTTESGLCAIKFDFSSNRVELEQYGDYSGCGFGQNVFATGVLKRTSYKPPKFCYGDPRSGGCDDAP